MRMGTKAQNIFGLVSELSRPDVSVPIVTNEFYLDVNISYQKKIRNQNKRPDIIS